MNLKKAFAAAALTIASTSAFAGGYYHPVTNDLVFDENSISFSNACSENEVSFNDGSLDLVYNNFQASSFTGGVSKTCQFKIDLKVPAGWRVVVSTEAGIGGLYVGPALASFQHSLAGTTRQAAFRHFPAGDGSFAINQSLKEVGSSFCGKDLTLKTVANIVALSDASFINLNSGSLNGTTTAWKYYWHWVRC